MSKRKRFSGKEKISIVKQHLTGKKSVADLAEEYGVKPSQIYTWTNQLFENGERAFERKNCRLTGEGAAKRKEAELDALNQKLANKNAVISELMEELVIAKKYNGALWSGNGSR